MTAPIYEVRRHARPISRESYVADVLDAVGDADVVLLGEASHGTHEFYQMRVELTRALIMRRGFRIVAVEADWPDAYRVNQFVRHASFDATAGQALDDFTRFPRWMWRNHVVVEFLEWLRGWNSGQNTDGRVGFYGLDLYSLHRSIDCVLDYLRKIDPKAADLARRQYGCFDIFGQDMQFYGYAATLGLAPSCTSEVIGQLLELRRQAAEYARRDGRIAADEYFVAEQNARLVRNAEEYYRAMFRDGVRSWNLRDEHMMGTLEALLKHAEAAGGGPRAVVWAHNSHLGDARETSMSRRGEWNVGQLARQRFGSRCRSVGFTTHEGTVTAASAWDEPAACMRVRPSLDGSWERLFHDVGLPAFVLRMDEAGLAGALVPDRLERAIGVIYRPDTERVSHYFSAAIARQFDVVIHVDESRAVEPLETWSRHETDLPETYPTGV